MIWVLVAIAGALGAASRFLVSQALLPRSSAQRPWGTLVVNVTGALAAGSIAAAVTARWLAPETAVVVAGGFLGAYTTFSTAMVEAVQLAQRRSGAAALALVVGESIAALVAAGVGWVVVTGMLRG